jgi:hypothetical protein
MNRAERRAVEFGRGRNEPFTDVVDINTLRLYLFGLPAFTDTCDVAFENTTRVFIEFQISAWDWSDAYIDAEDFSTNSPYGDL